MSSPDEPTVQSMSGTQLPLPWALLRRGRQLYGLYFFLGGCFKVLIGLLWSDTLKSMFLERLLDIPAETFAYEYLTSFAIPNAFFVAYVLTLGELCVGLLFMLNVFAKWGAVLAIFITINIGIGGFFSWILVGFILFPFVVIFLNIQKIILTFKLRDQLKETYMTGNERDTLTQFLRDLQQTRPSEIDEQANGLINEVMSSHPHASYVLASRCILLEKELANNSSSFLGASLADWCVNSEPVRKPFIAAVPGGNPNIPAHLLMEEKAINFLGNNALVVWIFIIAFSAVVVYLRN